MTPVYAAPTADLVDTSITGDTRLFSLNGRIGRARWLGYSFGAYMIGFGALMVLMALLGMLDSSLTVWGPVASVPVNLAIFLIFARRRLQDLGLSPFFILLTLIPAINLIFFLVLLFKRGENGPNQYGPPPRANDTTAIVLACITPAIVVIGILAAVAIPAYQGYIMKARAAEQLRMPPR